LVAGLHVREDFSEIRGVIVRAQGEGKYLRFELQCSRQRELTLDLAEMCRRIATKDNVAVEEWVSATHDLTVLQAEMIQSLRGACGSAAESLLAACIIDPGLWMRDFDNRWNYESFCRPDWLALHSGVSVIDALPAKDLAAGGHGWPLTPLAAWLLAADRANPVATHSRLLLVAGFADELYYLPVSDGLDDEYPAVQYLRMPGPEFLRSILRADTKALPADGIHAASQRQRADELWKAWTSADERTASWGSAWWQRQAMIRATEEVLQDHPCGGELLDESFARWSESRWERFLQRLPAPSGESVQILLAGDAPRAHGALTAVRRRFNGLPIEPLERLELESEYLPALLAAGLGAMHIDQMPANLPWLTGAPAPRILGRLTPGPPQNWRLLLLEMADYHPPAMRLRDAV
jgi:1,6-anhydro-N-acetylmuramate kinase